MQAASRTRRAAGVLRPPWILLKPERIQPSNVDAVEASHSSGPWRCNRSNIMSAGIIRSINVGLPSTDQQFKLQYQTCSTMVRKALFSSTTSSVEGESTEAVKELYDKMIKAVVEQRTAPPNAWLWSLIEKCANTKDIKLLFNILQKLRIFRLSNLRIHDDFNCALCREITKACVRVGAIDFGMKALWKHNVYGLTPTIGSAHHLLVYAKEHNDAKLMVEIMKLVQKNDLPLQPGTADIVLSICYKTDKWELMCKYAKRFVKAGAKLRQSSFDMWMDFAARIGDVDALWKIEKLRSESMKKHSLATGFSCAKGLLLEGKPEDAAAVIQVLDQTLTEAKKPGIMVELQKLVSEWPTKVITHQKKDDQEALAAALKRDIPAMVEGLLSLGLEVNVNMEDLTGKEGVLC